MKLDKNLGLPQAADAKLFDVPPALINPNASEPAKRLMRFLADIYGRYILSGQYVCSWRTDPGIDLEITAIQKITGRTPAVLGCDLAEYSPSKVSRGRQGFDVERAIRHHNAGGIVTFHWHWNAPEEYITGDWQMGFRADQTSIDLAKIMNGGDDKGLAFLNRDIDVVSEQLKILQNAGVPVLWRPLHEAHGDWFWWGAAGAQANIALWRYLYDRLTHTHGLNNLIWLWNGQAADYYPGDSFVDIIGEDIYAGERNYAPQTETFLRAAGFAGTPKIVGLSENGTLFDPDAAAREGAMWSFFVTWCHDFVLDVNNLDSYSEQHTEKDMLLKVYNHERVLALEDLAGVLRSH